MEERTGIHPCIWQIKVVHKVLEGGDVVTIPPTSSGKSFTYWMVLLYLKQAIPAIPIFDNITSSAREPNMCIPPLQVLAVPKGNCPKNRVQPNITKILFHRIQGPIYFRDWVGVCNLTAILTVKKMPLLQLKAFATNAPLFSYKILVLSY